jgi:glycerate 2-kinase
MTRKILVAPNSYKECADSVEAARIISFLLKKLTDYELITVPLSDGGDGFINVILHTLPTKKKTFETYSPLLSKIKIITAYDDQNKTLYVESADVIGLKLIPEDQRNPMYLTSAGLGALINSIVNKSNVEKIIVGVGGTGTNDLAFGMASILGCEFLDNKGNNINPLPSNFHLIEDIKWNKRINISFELVTDVNNPLTGMEGASYTYGPQKGLSGKDVFLIDKQFTRLVKLFERKGMLQKDTLLSGAGGGIAAGMQIFLDAKIKSSSEFLLKDLKLEKF